MLYAVCGLYYRVRGSGSRTDLCLQDLPWRVDHLVELPSDDVALCRVIVDGAEDGAEESELHGEHRVPTVALPPVCWTQGDGSTGVTAATQSCVAS